MPTYSVVAALEILAYVTLAIKIDFYCQLLGTEPSMTNTNFRKNLKCLTVGVLGFFFTF